MVPKDSEAKNRLFPNGPTIQHTRRPSENPRPVKRDQLQNQIEEMERKKRDQPKSDPEVHTPGVARDADTPGIVSS